MMQQMRQISKGGEMKPHTSHKNFVKFKLLLEQKNQKSTKKYVETYKFPPLLITPLTNTVLPSFDTTHPTPEASTSTLLVVLLLLPGPN
jgi:hypothetical protein